MILVRRDLGAARRGEIVHRVNRKVLIDGDARPP
jgi:hypothetical protein